MRARLFLGVLTAAAAILSGAALAQSSLPDPALTPGAINPAVTQENIGETICARGWSRGVRPPEGYTEALKRRQIREYGYADRRLRDYEEDHLVPEGLGGSPTDPRNLWPQPRDPADRWTAAMKDRVEARLIRLVCARRVPLAEAQQAIARDWHAAYQRYMQH